MDVQGNETYENSVLLKIHMLKSYFQDSTLIIAKSMNITLVHDCMLLCERLSVWKIWCSSFIQQNSVKFIVFLLFASLTMFLLWAKWDDKFQIQDSFMLKNVKLLISKV